MTPINNSNDVREHKPKKAKKKKKKKSTGKNINTYPISKIFHTEDISEKFEYGMSDW